MGSAKPAMVRLTFHDCVGGCDGCLNVNDPDNAGLEAESTQSNTLHEDNLKKTQSPPIVIDCETLSMYRTW